MARLSSEKLAMLKKVFTEDAMTPGQAAQAAGVTYATAQRWYEKWGDEIRRSLEARLLPSLEASVERVGRKRRNDLPGNPSKHTSTFGMAFGFQIKSDRSAVRVRGLPGPEAATD